MPSAILGVPFVTFVLWITAATNFIGAGMVYPSFRREKENLINSFFVWILGMALMHVFIGVGVWTGNMNWTKFGFFFGLTGSAYIGRIAFLTFTPKFERGGFYVLLIIAWLIILGLLIIPHLPTTMLWLSFGYMIVVAGIIGSLSLIYIGIKATDKIAKVKAYFGGSGIISCCLIADAMVLIGAPFLLREPLMAAGGLIIGVGLIIARRLERKVSYS